MVVSRIITAICVRSGTLTNNTPPGRSTRRHRRNTTGTDSEGGRGGALEGGKGGVHQHQKEKWIIRGGGKGGGVHKKEGRSGGSVGDE